MSPVRWVGRRQMVRHTGRQRQPTEEPGAAGTRSAGHTRIVSHEEHGDRGVPGIGDLVGERMGHSTCERDPHPERGLPGDGTLMTPYPYTHGGEAPTFAGDVLPSRPAAGLQETGPVVLSNAPTVAPHRQHGHAGVLCHDDGDRPWLARFPIGHGLGAVPPCSAACGWHGPPEAAHVSWGAASWSAQRHGCGGA